MTDRHIEVSIDAQTLTLFDHGHPLRVWSISTASRGVGFVSGSYRTPTGRFRIAEKIGDGAPIRTRFESRQPKGIWNELDSHSDGILTRILWLDGQDPENRNSRDRFIYIHGTNQESRLGKPASHGCVRMGNQDMIELFDLVAPGTTVIIHPPLIMKHRLIFFDCDSTLSSIEGIDELARARGGDVFRQVEELTHAAMNGVVPIHEVFPRRMELIAPDKALCDQVAKLYIETITPGSRELVKKLQHQGWTIIILSGGFKPLIEPLAAELGIEHVEAVPLRFHEDGSYAGYGVDYPTTRNGGKPEIIREWKQALPAEFTIMVGDGVSDLESRSACDLFVGYGGVIDREKVRWNADVWIKDMSEFPFDKLPSLRGNPHDII
jgi:phosphoserine phosphatase